MKQWQIPAKCRRRRIVAIDIARGAALLAMASYHFTWDLEFFGYAPAGLTRIRRLEALCPLHRVDFLFLVGVSLVLAHAQGIRWNGFWKRFAMVAGAAAARLSLATYFATPGGFIFFGILHQIALASLLGLAFLRLPAVLTLVVAALVIAAPHYLRSPFFDHPSLVVGRPLGDPPALQRLRAAVSMVRRRAGGHGRSEVAPAPAGVLAWLADLQAFARGAPA